MISSEWDSVMEDMNRLADRVKRLVKEDRPNMTEGLLYSANDIPRMAHTLQAYIWEAKR